MSEDIVTPLITAGLGPNEAADVRLRLKSIRLNHSTAVLDVPHSGVVCIVGANNTGKTQTLRDIRRIVVGEGRRVVVNSVMVDKEPPMLEEEHASAWIDAGLRTGSLRVDSWGNVGPFFLESADPVRNSNPTMPAATLAQSWNAIHPESPTLTFDENESFSAIGDFFFWFLPPASLLDMASQEYAGPSAPGSPVQGELLQSMARGRFRCELSNLCRENFGFDLEWKSSVHPRWVLRPDVDDSDRPLSGREDEEWIDMIESQPTLAEQGHGVRSALGLMLAVMVGTPGVFLIDEPEAFLHPNQARALGRWLAQQASRLDKQLIVATHDSDLLLGAIESGESVAVWRLTRDGNDNTMREVSADAVRPMLEDPILRYTNVAQGLFYDTVVVCENPKDCMYYEALLDATCDAAGGDRRQVDDTLFVGSFGKSALGSVARSVRTLGARVRIIADFDLLTVRVDLERLVDTLGHSMEDIEDDYVMEGRCDLKTKGLDGLEPGSPERASTVRLLAKLGGWDVFVVPVGELEDWDQEVKNRVGKQGFVWEAMTKERLLAATRAQGFISGVVSPDPRVAQEYVERHWQFDASNCSPETCPAVGTP